MRHSPRFVVPLVTLAVLALLGACAQISNPPGENGTAMLYWPDGNAAAGKQAFVDLKCYQCHRVESVPDLAALNHEPLGPALDSVTAKRERMDILVQIVAPGTAPDIQESHMGNFDDVMTVSQLTDLVAFVESLHT
ncbi:MAG TPA: c-type cytochrome [Candidatus Saccharimonadales bacterium]|nr:c-type cytochrome [Candidatus Saccharimonadales bacterium]